MQISDLSNPSAIHFSNIEVDSYITAMAMAPTGEGLAFSDADGIVHLWNTAEYGEEARYPRFVEPIELPDPPEPPRQVNWSSDTPLSMVGMPYYDQPLLSIIPWANYSSIYSPIGQPPKKPDPAMLATLKTVDFVGYAVNPKTRKRNQAVLRGGSSQDAKRKMDVPLFRSERDRERAQRRKQRKKSEPVSDAYRQVLSLSLTARTAGKHRYRGRRRDCQVSYAEILPQGRNQIQQVWRRRFRLRVSLRSSERDTYADIYRQLLQQNAIQRSGDAHPKFVHELATSGLALPAAHTQTSGRAYMDRMSQRELLLVRARVPFQDAERRKGYKLSSNEFLQSFRNESAR